MNRQFLLKLHLIVGLTAGSLLTVIGLSGASLAFRGEIDRALHPALYAVGPATPAPALSDVAELASRTSGAAIATIALPRTPGAPYVVTTMDEQEVFVASTGQTVQGMRHAAQAPLAVVLRFHRTLLAGDVGHVVVGSIALLALLLVASGLILWLPRSWRLLKSRLTVNFKAPPARVGWDLHHAVGVFAAIGLTLSATTGAVFAFKTVSQPLLGALTATPAPRLEGPTLAAQPNGPLRSPDEVIATARMRFPQANVLMVRYPKKPTEAFRIDMKQPGEVHPNGRSIVWVDPHQGQLLKAIDPFQAPLSWRMYYYYNFPLHTGEILGVFGQALMAASSLTPLVLFTTGLMIWNMKRRASAQRRPPAPMREAVPTVSSR